VPGGAFYAFPNISAHLSNRAGKPALAKSCTEITKMLLEKVQVAVVPGEAFGAPGYLRLSYATSIERMKKVCGASSVFSLALKPRLIVGCSGPAAAFPHGF